MAWEAFGKPRPDQGLDTAVDFGDGVAQAAQCTGGAGFVAHGKNAAIGRDDFGTRERGKLDRHVLDIVEILEDICICRRHWLNCFIYHRRSSERLDAAPAPEFARVPGRTTERPPANPILLSRVCRRFGSPRRASGQRSLFLGVK